MRNSVITLANYSFRRTPLVRFSIEKDFVLIFRLKVNFKSTKEEINVMLLLQSC